MAWSVRLQLSEVAAKAEVSQAAREDCCVWVTVRAF